MDRATSPAAGFGETQVAEIVPVAGGNFLANLINPVARTDIGCTVVAARAGHGWRAAMAYGFLDIAATPAVKAAQEANGSLAYWQGFAGDRAFDSFTEAEAEFIAERDSLYIASVSASGWPYVQHRGGPPGFVRQIDERTLGFADFRGNRQYISVGNIAGDDRVSLILMDYPGRRRLKIFARAETIELAERPELAAVLALPAYKAKVERGVLLHLEAFDWNCPQHITARYSEAEIAAGLAPLHERLAALEAENAVLRARLAEGE